MNETQHLLATARARAATALATVVETHGSAYRRPGARLLLADGTALTGSVCGGCLEADIAEHSRELEGPTLLQYDTTDEMLGLGCHGFISILLEPTPAPLLEYLHQCLTERKNGLVATVYRGPNFGQRYYGADLPPALTQAAQQAITEGRYTHWHDNDQSVLLEAILPPTALVICGGGWDAVPVARLALELGWTVHVVDHRPDTGRFPVPTIPCLPQIDAHTVALIMAHNLAKDEAYLQQLLRTDIPYLGVLGPKKRTHHLLAKHDALDDPRVHFPVGLDIGADNPAAIALAILAEVTAVLNRRSAGFLKDRNGPIHSYPPRLQTVKERVITRREFIAISAALGGTMVAAQWLGPAPAEAAPPKIVPGPAVPKMPVRLTVNGAPKSVQLDPRMSLLDLIREHLHLTGTKKGCDHGQCGACTVLLNGRRINSCLTLAIMHDGDEVVTIEGLGRPSKLHPMQKAFLSHDGFQCGYCTPGQICSAVGVLDEIRAGIPSHVTGDLNGPMTASEDEIRERMSGNICRCAAYTHIIAAVREVASGRAA